jgi:hypothetical protein
MYESNYLMLSYKSNHYRYVEVVGISNIQFDQGFMGSYKMDTESNSLNLCLVYWEDC